MSEKKSRVPAAAARFPVRIAVLLAALLCAACANLSGEPRIVATILPATSAPPTDVPVPDRGVPAAMPDLANGARLYAENCAACHGESGRGDGPVAQQTEGMAAGDFTDPATAREQTPHEWFRTITHGRIENLMPPWGNVLTEQERWDVALYTYTMHYDAERLWVGERIYQDCAECHGPQGRGDGPQAADSRIGVKDLSDPEAMVTLSDGSMFRMVTHGFEDVMPAYDELPEEDRWAVIEYARTLSLQNVPQLDAPAAAPTPASGTTDRLSSLTGTALLLQVHAVGDTLRVVQALRVRNLAETLAYDAAMTLDDGSTAAFAITLPDGAVLTSSAGIDAVSPDGRTVYAAGPLAPLSEQLFVVGYTLPWEIGTPVEIPLDIVIAGPVRVLVRPLELSLRSDILPSFGEEVLGNELYNAYGDQLALQAGAALSFVLEGTPDEAAEPAAPPEQPVAPRVQAPAGVVTADVLTPLILLGVLAVVGSVGWLAWRTRRLSPEARIMQIAREIGRIDAAHQAGTLNHDLWHRQRAALKAEQMRLRGYPDEAVDE